jgi:hypothetical protein
MVLHLSPYPVEVDLYLRGYEGPRWDVSPFRHREGWLMMASVSLETPFGPTHAILVAVMTDQGELFAQDVAEKILEIPTGLPVECEVTPPEELEEMLHWQYWDFLGANDLESLARLEAEESANESRIAAFEAECRQLETMTWKAVRKLRRERGQSGVSPTRLTEIDDQLLRLSTVPDEMLEVMQRRLKKMRTSLDALEEAVIASTQDYGTLEVLAILRWRAVTDYVPSLRDNTIRVGIPAPKDKLSAINQNFASHLRRGFTKLEGKVGALINGIEADETLSTKDIQTLKAHLASLLTMLDDGAGE